MTDEKITTSGDTEGTAYPWWAIVDPRLGIIRKDGCVHAVADMITGPFFSRASADEALSRCRYNYGTHAAVYCFSGHKSWDYRDRIEAARSAVPPQWQEANELRDSQIISGARQTHEPEAF